MKKWKYFTNKWTHFTNKRTKNKKLKIKKLKIKLKKFKNTSNYAVMYYCMYNKSYSFNC